MPDYYDDEGMPTCPEGMILDAADFGIEGHLPSASVRYGPDDIGVIYQDRGFTITIVQTEVKNA
jgi:hypothetical protein